MVGHAIKLIEAEAHKSNVEININMAKQEPAVEVDADKSSRFCLIFLNALAAMKNGGRLDISLGQEKDGLCVVIVDTALVSQRRISPRLRSLFHFQTGGNRVGAGGSEK